MVKKLTSKCVWTMTALKTIVASWTLVSRGRSANLGHRLSHCIVRHKKTHKNTILAACLRSPGNTVADMFAVPTCFGMLLDYLWFRIGFARRFLARPFVCIVSGTRKKLGYWLNYWIGRKKFTDIQLLVIQSQYRN